MHTYIHAQCTHTYTYIYTHTYIHYKIMHIKISFTIKSYIIQ